MRGITLIALEIYRLAQAAANVRTRRAYFDFEFGQLHVRTAFPATGGFDEQVTLFCLHADAELEPRFRRFLPQIADVRSVYAPDLPGLRRVGSLADSSVQRRRRRRFRSGE